MSTEMTGALAALSGELAGVVERLAPTVVCVDDGSRLTATGTVWRADGIIVSTSHGVESDENLAVELDNGTRLPATLVGRDPDTDLAVLRVDATGLSAATPAPDDAVKAGHLALALGRPGASGLHATLGLVSARIESQTEGAPEYLLATDAVLYPGFSGGPLVNMAGQTLGIVNRMLGRGQGIAVGAPIVERTVTQLLAHGSVQRGYLGVRTQTVSLPEALRGSLGLEQSTAVLLVQVETGTPAEQGGLMLGDTILHLNNAPVTDTDDLRQTLRALAAGDAIALRLLRGGETKDVSVTLGKSE